jgi:hypothetical protein
MSNLTIGKIANNSITLVLKSELHIGVGADGTMRFEIDMPNHMGAIIAGKSRCLLQVQSVAVSRVRANANNGTTLHTNPGAIDDTYKSPMVCGVRIDGLASSLMVVSDAPSVSSNTSFVGALDLVFAGPTVQQGAWGGGDGDKLAANIPAKIDVGQMVFATSGDILNNGVLCQNPFGKHLNMTLINLTTGNALCTEMTHGERPELKPVIIKMRLLFLDEEDLKEF